MDDSNPETPSNQSRTNEATRLDETTKALIATHNPALAARMDRTLRLTDGFLFPE